MRICKLNEAGLVFGQGGPMWGGVAPTFSFTPPAETPTINGSSTSAELTIAQVVISTPSGPGTFVTSPSITTISTGTNQFGDRTTTINTTSFGSAGSTTAGEGYGGSGAHGHGSSGTNGQGGTNDGMGPGGVGGW